MPEYKLTQFSPGAGCGCKISPGDLEEILKTEMNMASFPQLLVGNESKDDAAAFDIGNGQAILSTTDFFTPIVDDPFDFGRIAATNALSDIYAMGGKPLMSIVLLGWPLDKLPGAIAKQVIEGAREVCKNAGIPLAGGHSIDISDPIFGLAVTGIIDKKNIKQNNQATEGGQLFLTKPLGVGITTTAEKNGLVQKEDIQRAVKQMTTLNSLGYEIGKLDYVKAMTDVTGFALLGHLLEICESSGVSAELNYSQIPLLENVQSYAEQKCLPGGTFRNWKTYEKKIGQIEKYQRNVLCDPQTSGGLLVAVENERVEDFIALCKKQGHSLSPIGQLKAYDGSGVYIHVGE